jgi:anti-sigma-K factor RskA
MTIDTTNSPHIPDDDLVLFTLQLLADDRMRQAKQHLDTCVDCRSEVARLQGDLVAYSMTTEMQAPPPAARERLLRQIAREPRALAPEPVPVPVAPERAAAAPTRSSEPVFAARRNRGLRLEAREDDEPRTAVLEPEFRPRSSRAPWVLAWVGWAVAAGCSFVAGLQYRQRELLQTNLVTQQARIDDMSRDAAHAQDALATLTAANAMQVALHPALAVKTTPGAKPAAAATATPEAMAAYLADKGALVFVATHMDAPPAGKTYELWLLPATGSPIAAGTFKPDSQGSASVVLPQIPKGVPAKGFGVTVENDGGSDVPTSPVMMASS